MKLREQARPSSCTTAPLGEEIVGRILATRTYKADRQLILLDARGHGASDKPHDPAAYDLRLRVGDVTAVLDDLEIRRADYFGYSMGGWIGFGLAKHAPVRL